MANPVTEVGGHALGKSVKSLPPMVWVLAIGGGLVVAYYLHSKSTAASTTASTTASTPTVLTYTGVGGGDTTGTSATTTTGAATTNQQWATNAQNYLLAAFPQYNAIDVSNAINAYIQEQSLTAQQQAMVSEAIQGVGPAPQSLSTGGTTTTTTSQSTSVVQPPIQQTVTLPRDMLLQDIVAAYMPIAGWGKANESGHDVYPGGNVLNMPGYDYDIWTGAMDSVEIMEANPQLNFAYEIPAGTQVNIPYTPGALPASSYTPPPAASGTTGSTSSG